MKTITRKGLQLAINDEIIPAQGSSDVPIQFINDNETYQNYLIEPRVGWFKDGYPKSTVAKYENGIIYLPAEVFAQNGKVVIVIALIDPQNSNHIEVTQPVILAIANAPLGDIILPEKETWEQAVTSLVKQLNEQIQADVAAAIKKANKASEDAKAALTKSNQTNQTINEKIEDGSFVPQATAGTVEMTQPGTKAEVTITGDKKTPEFNFKIPKDEIDDSEDIKKALLQGTYTTDLAEEYKGVASDYGAEILKIEGKSEQGSTKGYQLFDASKLSTKTQGGATVTNNGDGSFTISGSGNLTDSFFVQYDVVGNDEIKKLLKVGMLSLKTNGAIKAYETNPYFHIYLSDKANERLLVIVNGQKEVTQDILNKSEKLTFTFWGSSGEAIQGGTIKPMLYQEGDGTWEPFTGGEPSPNPNYPQEINNALDEPLVSVSRNLFNASSLKEDGVINFKNEENGYKISLESNGNYKKVYCFIAENLLKALKGNSIKLKCSEDTVFSTHGAINLVVKRKNKKTEFYGINRSTFETKIIELTDDVELIKVEIIPINLGTEQENYQKLIAVGLRLYDVSNGDVEWEPYRCAETSLDLSEPLRSLPDGTCDTYDNGVITRRIGVINVDGDTQFASLNTNQNIAYLIISKYSVSGNKFFSGLCDKAKVVQTWGLKPNEITIMESPDFGGMRVLFSVPEEVNTLELLKAYFTENPMTVYYQLKTPTTEKVELPIIPTFYPYTNIYQSDDVKAKIQYGLRSKVEECPYDIGDLYITLNDTLPSVKWKGTKWERVEGLVPVGYKESDADFGTLGKTGGAKTVTLTEEQIPEHGHQAKAKKAGNHKHGIALKTATGSATPHTGAGIKEGSWSSTDTHAWLDKGLCEELGEHDHVITVENAGGSQEHNNLQPYKVFNMWLRTK